MSNSEVYLKVEALEKIFVIGAYFLGLADILLYKLFIKHFKNYQKLNVI